jgi:hypothetical protein
MLMSVWKKNKMGTVRESLPSKALTCPPGFHNLFSLEYSTVELDEGCATLEHVKRAPQTSRWAPLKHYFLQESGGRNSNHPTLNIGLFGQRANLRNDLKSGILNDRLPNKQEQDLTGV